MTYDQGTGIYDHPKYGPVLYMRAKIGEHEIEDVEFLHSGNDILDAAAHLFRSIRRWIDDNNLQDAVIHWL